MKKKFTLATILGTFLVMCSFAQPNKKDDIDALRVTIFNKTMGMSTDESAKFWPVYNDYMQKKETARKSHMAANKVKYQNLDKLSDEEANALIKAEQNYKQTELDLHVDMMKKVKIILSPKKTALIYKAEEEFRKKLMELVKEKNEK